MIYYYDYLNKQRIDNPTQIGLKYTQQASNIPTSEWICS